MIIESGQLEHIMKTQNPFVMAAYHPDQFPQGDDKLEPSEKRPYNRNGDYDPDAPWRMYFGERVPGFPAHPHRGFETVTVVVQGTVDHTDGLGSKGRYENGDVQWMTAGRGLQHAEMFPLRHTDSPNTLELFQLWLSLDKANRMVEPAYKMLWNEEIPDLILQDEKGLKIRIRVIAGEVDGHRAPDPAPDSWAMDKNHHVAIQTIELDPGAVYEIPAGSDTIGRSLYFYAGEAARVDDQVFSERSYAFVTAGDKTVLSNEGNDPAKFLLLDAQPIPEPIIAHGPFVMTTMEEIRQAYRDFQATQFGGWPFPSGEVYHDPEQERFATYADGTIEYPERNKAREHQQNE